MQVSVDRGCYAGQNVAGDYAVVSVVLFNLTGKERFHFSAYQGACYFRLLEFRACQCHDGCALRFAGQRSGSDAEQGREVETNYGLTFVYRFHCGDYGAGVS